MRSYETTIVLWPAPLHHLRRSLFALALRCPRPYQIVFVDPTEETIAEAKPYGSMFTVGTEPKGRVIHQDGSVIVLGDTYERLLSQPEGKVVAVETFGLSPFFQDFIGPYGTGLTEKVLAEVKSNIRLSPYYFREHFVRTGGDGPPDEVIGMAVVQE